MREFMHECTCVCAFMREREKKRTTNIIVIGTNKHYLTEWVV